MNSRKQISQLRATALSLFAIGVERADPAAAVRSALQARAAAVEAASRVFLMAFGKAAIPMTRAALPLVEAKLAGAVAVTNAENMSALERVHVIAGGHPLPNNGSLEGAAAVEALARQACEGDLVLVLVSGGGSALLCAPAEGLTLHDKIALNDALIRSGADIAEINCVRSVASRLKGGGLARLAAPADLLALILSDVPRDDLATIASGPTVLPQDPEAARAVQAQEVLARYGLAGQLPAVEAHLQALSARGASTQIQPHPENILIGSNALSVEAMIAAAREKGWQVEHASPWLEGDVADAAQQLHRIASRTAVGVPTAALCGGETTVRVTGKGLGGRNQELALRFTLAAQQAPLARPWAFLSGGTDGRDGPTDAAGAVVDADTPARIRNAGLDPQALLADNDAYHALDASGDLLRMGATGTNVADLQILLLA